LKLGVINIHDINIKKIQLKKWGHRACFGVSRLLKWGIFTGAQFGVHKETDAFHNDRIAKLKGKKYKQNT